MENNPIMQRLHKLTHQWKKAVEDFSDVKLFAWVGSSSADYKMLKGFSMYHTSKESTIEDVFFCFHQPFSIEENYLYGTTIVNDIEHYINAWNESKELTAETGIINWKPLDKAAFKSDEDWFVKNVNQLADCLQTNKKDNILAIVLMPQQVGSYESFSEWLTKMIQCDLSRKVKIMTYDTYDLKAFSKIEKNKPSLFKYLYLDLDMTGAMNEILEDAKAAKNNPAEKDAVSFQQNLLKMNEAISCAWDKKIELYKSECLSLAAKHHWPHMQALVYFFVHGFYNSQGQEKKAFEDIGKAIVLADEAVDKKLLASPDLKYQYRIAKANLFFMKKKFEDAASLYEECLQLDRTSIDKNVLVGIHQMHGNCLRQLGWRKMAWQSFEQGWSLLKNEDALFFQRNTIVMLYAKDMLDAASEANAKAMHYYDTMTGWWGEGWLRNMRNNKYNHVTN